MDFVNAKQMSLENPTTFFVPSEEELNNLKLKDFVKVSIGTERFWVKIKKIDGDKIIGEVYNNLIRTHIHGLSYLDEVTIIKDNVFQITPK